MGIALVRTHGIDEQQATRRTHFTFTNEAMLSNTHSQGHRLEPNPMIYNQGAAGAKRAAYSPAVASKSSSLQHKASDT